MEKKSYEVVIQKTQHSKTWKNFFRIVNKWYWKFYGLVAVGILQKFLMINLTNWAKCHRVT